MSLATLRHLLAERVLARRRDRGWTRRDLADHAGISERFLADIETARANPSLERLCALASALETTPHELLASAPARRGIVLLGLRGAGKSSVGLALAARLGQPFCELDREVEAFAGLTLPEVLEVHGEAYYRRIEHLVLRELLGGPEPGIIATGGGIVTFEASLALLGAAACCVWLRARPEDHWQRVIAQGDTRPMANNARAFADLRALLAEREPLYRRAHLVIDTSGRSIDDLAAELAQRLSRSRLTGRSAS